MADHKPGCEGLGGYGHGAGPCECGADAQTPVLTDDEIAGVEAHLYGTGRARMRVFARIIEAAVVAKLAAQAPAQPAEAVAWEYRNQHGNPFLSHTDPHKRHPHDQAGFGQFRALVYAAPAQPDRAVMQQALDALRAVRLNMLQNAPHLSGKVWGDADAAIAALSATMEKPHGN